PRPPLSPRLQGAARSPPSASAHAAQRQTPAPDDLLLDPRAGAAGSLLCPEEQGRTLLAEEQGMRCAVRLGLRLVAGLAEKETQATLLDARGSGFPDIASLWRRSGAPVSLLERLADADAFRSLGCDRRRALWAVKGLGAAGAK